MCIVKAEGKVYMHSGGEKCRARKTARRDESSTENYKVDYIPTLISEIMHGTELGSNFEKSPSQVTFSGI